MLRRLEANHTEPWNFQRVLHTLAATQELPRHNRLHLRGSTRVRPTFRGVPFPPPTSRGGILSLRGRESIPGDSVAPQEEALSTGKARGTPGSCHHSQSPPDVSVHSRENCFPALPPLSSRGSTHTKVARGTTLWESLVGKPQIPLYTRREARRWCYSSDGKRT